MISFKDSEESIDSVRENFDSHPTDNPRKSSTNYSEDVASTYVAALKHQLTFSVELPVIAVVANC